MTHPDVNSHPVGSHPLLSRLLKGMFNSRPPAPRYSASWDVSRVINYLGTCRSDSLPLLALAKKLATLMALRNADRCSDLVALDRDHMRETPAGAKFTVVLLTKTRKSGIPRVVCYSAFTDNVEICPFTILWAYLSRTTELVATLEHPRPWFTISKKTLQEGQAWQCRLVDQRHLVTGWNKYRHFLSTLNYRCKYLTCSL